MNIQDIRQSFAPVLEHLNTVGTAVLAVEATKHKAAPGAHCLLDYKRQSSTIAGWPIVGDCDFQVEYDTKLGAWTVSGKAFGMDFVGNDPRAAAAQLTANLNATRNSLSAILERSQWYINRYGEDPRMFAHRLGVELASTADVQHKAYGCRVTSIDAPQVAVDFHTDGKRGITHFCFDGMSQDQWMLTTPESMFKVRTQTASFVNDAIKFIMRMGQLMPQPGVAALAFKRVV